MGECCTPGGPGCPGPQQCQVTPCFAGTFSRLITTTESKSISWECGCFNPVGISTDEITIDGSNCTCDGFTAPGGCDGCPLPTADMPAPFGCEASISGFDPGPGNPCCSPPCSGIHARGGSLNAVNVNSDIITQSCRISTLDVCNIGTITWDSEIQIITEGISVHDGADLGWTRGSCAAGGDGPGGLLDRENTAITTNEWQATWGPWICDNCDFGPIDPPTAEYIDDWAGNWVCGLPNRLATTGIPV
jgi:hypothetical protein